MHLDYRKSHLLTLIVHKIREQVKCNQSIQSLNVIFDRKGNQEQQQPVKEKCDKTKRLKKYDNESKTDKYQHKIWSKPNLCYIMNNETSTEIRVS